jgi:hypothetical protein
MWGRSRPAMDVSAYWAQEEAKTLEERRAARPSRYPATPVDAMIPWTVHSARLTKYKAIHTIEPPTIIRQPTALFHLKSMSGNNHFYLSRATPSIVASDAANAETIAKYQASLPSEQGSVRTLNDPFYLNPSLSFAHCLIEVHKSPRSIETYFQLLLSAFFASIWNICTTSLSLPTLLSIGKFACGEETVRLRGEICTF